MYVAKSSLKPLKHQGKDGYVEVIEYGGLNSSMDIGIARISGNYPGEGKHTCNKKVDTMTFHILAGSCLFAFKDGEVHELQEGDCVFIARDRMYRVEVAEGEVVEVLMASNPAWTPDQVEVS